MMTEFTSVTEYQAVSGTSGTGTVSLARKNSTRKIALSQRRRSC
ncbi:hypothetical protein [Parendozoicomonas callyspongiae]|nr:hypothetical protein [Sansalvadorimonas sp. 2012CJ34-2]